MNVLWPTTVNRERNLQIESMAMRRVGLIRGARTDERNIKARLNRGRMPIWNYIRRAGITGSRRLGLRLRFCLTCLTRDKNVIRGTGHQATRGWHADTEKRVLPSSPTTTPRRTTWERYCSRKKSLLIHRILSIRTVLYRSFSVY